MMDTKDKEIARLLQKDLPEAGKDAWFTRKVLNRLPRRHSQVSPVEWGCIITVSLLLVAAFIIESANIMNSQQLFVRDILIMATLTMMSLGVAGWIIKPYIRN